MTELIHGFERIEERDIPEISSKATLYRHARTGAELLSLENDDENKAFMISFKTPPEDDTGLPHIMEHSVLCGSRKYPVKEPFVELYKTSLNTFLNAMTRSDSTVYPVASTNLQDFYNLTDVYLDAVFYPRIDEKTLMRQGWHYETRDGEEIEFKGVVFNEMKGYYSTPDIVMNQEAQAALMPDTPYANSSGGDPAAMPDLTYEQFKSFHENLYHPSNARIFFYGDDDPEERLRRINEFIEEFERKEVEADIPLQSHFDQPRRKTIPYDSGEFGPDSKKAQVQVSWLLPEVTDTETRLALRVLSHALVSTPASPLRKVLIDSGLGEDLTGGGYSASQRQGVFSTGLKGIAAEDANQVEDLILSTLSILAEEGIDDATIEASLNTVEFNLRERNTGRFPRGLMTAMETLPAWLHGGNPLDVLEFEDKLAAIKERYANDDEYFQNMIGEYFIDNPHRSTLILTPDPSVKEKREAAEQQRLNEARANMTDDDLRAIEEMQEQLRVEQETPNTPEELATIPTLTVDDIDREIKTVPTETIEQDGATIYYHDLPTAGIAYLDIGMDLHALPQELVPYVELFGTALTKMGTEDDDFVTLSQRIGSQTGGIGTSLNTSVKHDSNDTIAHLFVKSKTMLDKSANLLDILRDILLTVNLDDQERFLQLVLERKARMEAYLNMAGHLIDLRRIRAQFNDADWATEQMQGVSNLFFTRELVDKVRNDWDTVRENLHAVRDALVNRNAIIINATMSNDDWATFKPQLDNFLNDLPAQETTQHTWQREATPRYEGLTLPAQVNFVGKGTNLFAHGYELDGSHVTVLKHLNMTYLWNRIRVQGGAYGGTFSFNPYSGVGVFLSWQDPNIVDTLATYDQAGAYLQSLDFDQDELERAIIGAIGQVDDHKLPDAKGFSATIRELMGITDEFRQQYRDQILDTTMDDFRALGELLSDAMHDDTYIVVTGSPDALAKANEQLEVTLDIRDIN